MAGVNKVNALTIADLLAIPEEDRRHEIIDGELVEKGAASGRHGLVQARITRDLGPYDRRSERNKPGGWWIVTEAEVQFADTQVFRPDIAGWQRARLKKMPTVIPVTVRPDWICEILSTNRQNDLIKKKRAYHRHQVEHYWIADPEEETLVMYRWRPKGYVEVLSATQHDRVRAEPFTAIELLVSSLFDHDDDDDGVF